ncbi:unnamed protein product, partial [Mesorhabditis belari]|uniref:Ataxin-3 homolog n=1 Tax=Mesorhabditis belari TaxID=2138241 RepID=A0AAF3FGV8_9BILA
MDTIFFERQQAALCAQHALNMLLQGDYFSATDLAEIARRLDQEENVVLDSSSRNLKSVNMDDSGYFSVQVLSEAVKAFSLDLVSITHPSVADVRKDPLKEKAFICNQSEHWFTLRKFGDQWFVLNSVKAGPELISDTYMGMYLYQLEQAGYSIFIVRGLLPECEADQVISMCPVQQQALPPKQAAAKAGVMGGIGRRLGSIVEDLSKKQMIRINHQIHAPMRTRKNFSSEPFNSPNNVTIPTRRRSCFPQLQDRQALRLKSLDPSQNVKVRNIPIQLIDSESDIKAKREAFLNNMK